MGKVVDGSLNVRGVKNLRVVDASIVSSSFQAPVHFVSSNLLLTARRFPSL